MARPVTEISNPLFIYGVSGRKIITNAAEQKKILPTVYIVMPTTGRLQKDSADKVKNPCEYHADGFIDMTLH